MEGDEGTTMNDVPMIKARDITFEFMSNLDDRIEIVVSTPLTEEAMSSSWPPMFMHGHIPFYFVAGDSNVYPTKDKNGKAVEVCIAKYAITISAFEKAAMVIDERSQKKHFKSLDDMTLDEKINELNRLREQKMKSTNKPTRRRSDKKPEDGDPA